MIARVYSGNERYILAQVNLETLYSIGPKVRALA